MLDEVELVPPLLDDIMVLRPIADLITALMTGRINLGLMTLDTMTDLLLGLTMSVTDMTVGTGTMTEGTTIVMLETDTMITTEAAVVLPVFITTEASLPLRMLMAAHWKILMFLYPPTCQTARSEVLCLYSYLLARVSRNDLSAYAHY